MMPVSAKQAVRMAAAACFTVGAGASQAFTVTQPDVQSYLTQRLRARVHIDLAPGELPPTHVGLATAEDSTRYGLPPQSLVNLSVRTVTVAGGVDVFIESSSPVSEPMFTVLLDVRSGSLRSLREFTVLLDLPPIETMVADTASAPVSIPAPNPAAAPSAERMTSRARETAAIASPPPATHARRAGHGRAHVAANPENEELLAWTPPAASGSADERYGPVAANETLSHVAQIYRPTPTAPLPPIVAKIVAANPEVTLGRDNFLPEGATLKIPDELAPYRNAPWSGVPASVSRKKLKGLTRVNYRVNAAPRFQLAVTLSSLHDNPMLAEMPAPVARENEGVAAAAPSENTVAAVAPAAQAPAVSAPASQQPAAVESNPSAEAVATPSPEAASPSKPPVDVAAPSAPERVEPTTAVPAAVSENEPKVETARPSSGSRSVVIFVSVLAALVLGLLGWARGREIFNRARKPAMAAPLVAPVLRQDALASTKAPAAVKAEISPDERVVLLKQAYAARGKRFRDVRHIP